MTSLANALRGTSFQFDRRTFCSWLGVTQYLTTTAIEATLAFVLSSPRGSEIVVSFILPQDALSGIEADAVATAAAKSAEVGEPWLSRFDPAEFASRLRGMGFSEVVPLAPQQAYDRYLKERHDGHSIRHGEQMMRAIVTVRAAFGSWVTTMAAALTNAAVRQGPLRGLWPCSAA
jgi:O-methyltransferase involved in polyketide biosynthesis